MHKTDIKHKIYITPKNLTLSYGLRDIRHTLYLCVNKSIKNLKTQGEFGWIKIEISTGNLQNFLTNIRLILQEDGKTFYIYKLFISST